MRFLALILSMLCPIAVQAETPIRIFAAASLGEAVQELTALWEAQTGQKAQTSLAGSATLARQIVAGAPVDVFLSANAEWVSWVSDQGPIDAQAQVFATNRLVLVAPIAKAKPLALTPEDMRARLGKGRLAMGLPGAVPAGIYGQAAFEHLGLWATVEPKVAGTDSVRAALALVALGAAPLGVVYATDVAAEPRVAKVAEIPKDSHPKITYHAVSVTDQGIGFVTFLAGDAAQAVMQNLGFGPRAN